MTKAEQKVLTAMRRLNKVFAELRKERGVAYSGRFSACRIPPESGEEKTYYNIFGDANDTDGGDFSLFIKESVRNQLKV